MPVSYTLEFNDGKKYGMMISNTWLNEGYFVRDFDKIMEGFKQGIAKKLKIPLATTPEKDK